MFQAFLKKFFLRKKLAPEVPIRVHQKMISIEITIYSAERDTWQAVNEKDKFSLVTLMNIVY